MHVGPCGASSGCWTGAPRIDCACPSLTRLQGEKRDSGCLVWRLRSVEYPGAWSPEADGSPGDVVLPFPAGGDGCLPPVRVPAVPSLVWPSWAEATSGLVPTAG